MSPDRIVADRMLRHYEIARIVLWGLMVATFAVGVVTMVMLLNSVRDGQRAQRQTSSANGAILRAIQSCTLPTGECYQRGQAGQATAITALQRYTLIAVECAHAGSDKQIESCVLAKSREEGLTK